MINFHFFQIGKLKKEIERTNPVGMEEKVKLKSKKSEGEKMKIKERHISTLYARDGVFNNRNGVEVRMLRILG